MCVVSLKNKYWVLRHGKSIPNERGLIVSSMENGIRSEFQLAPDGVNQAQLAANSFQKELEANNIPLANVRICYSPFSRTTHTANVVATHFNIPFHAPHCKVIQDLRERYFGPSFELLSHDKYTEIWAIDEKDPFLGPEGGESVKDVASRLAKSMAVMESEFEGCAILVVSHGDPLQIFQTILHAATKHKEPTSEDLASTLAAVQVAPILSQHRQYALNTGELRAVI
ncbi:hypothetical protein TSUD_254680 [Trifolium subterraneum]|uniref:Uncharacterized protein n=1 Tax=Trifolium subterraneum TaxID=3900 RepID=A0A2Z6P5G7_TRISU|nr:hypothetical protein TSUD_254680 [Trifolium subterraneum]